MDNTLIDLQYLKGVWRRRWWLLVVPTIVGGLMAGFVAYVLPPTYVSTARLFVVSPEIPTELARSTVNIGITSAVNQFRQRLTSRPNLLDVAARFDAVPNRAAMSPGDVVVAMRNATTIRARGNNVEVSFESNRPAVAAQVANHFLTQLLQLTAEQRSGRAASTRGFFESEAQRLSTALRGMEDQISRFQNENRDAMPNTLEFRRSTVNNLRSQMTAREERRANLETRRQTLVDAINEGTIEALFGGEQNEAEDLRRLRAEIVRQSAVYAPSHPAIRRLEAQIAVIETARAEQRRLALQRQGLDSDLERMLRRTEEEIAQIDETLARMTDQDETATARIIELEASIEQTPAVAIALRSLDREYEALQMQYRQALDRQATAATGERIEVGQQSQRLEVVEQPQTPERPVRPKRVLIAGLGTAASFGFGLGLLVLLELLNRSVRSARDVESRLNMRPIVSIPYIWTEAQLSRRRWTARAAAASILVAVPLGLAAVDRYYAPLPVIAQRVMAQPAIATVIGAIETRFAL